MIKKVAKILFSGVIAFFILCAFFYFYYRVPVHKTSELKNTDYVWPANSSWIKFTEGISWGTFDEQGFNNKVVIKNPNILVLGSSHTEATNVNQNENFSYILQKNLGDMKSVYNMGISGHAFAKVLQYLPQSISLYPTGLEYIVIETSDIDLSENQIEKILNKSIEFTPSYDKGIISLLQKLPFLRVLYFQWEQGLKDLILPSHINIKDTKETLEKKQNDSSFYSKDYYNELFDYLQNLTKEKNIHIIIMYHPSENLGVDGTITYKVSKDLTIFKNKCKDYGIIFCDMTEDFYELFEVERKLPHGFITGRIGEGHLNKDGHRVIAKKLYKIIKTKEGE